MPYHFTHSPLPTPHSLRNRTLAFFKMFKPIFNF